MPVQVGEVRVGGGDLVVIAGPCVLEEPERVHRIAAGLVAACADAGVGLVFKASFDKANRTSGQSARGPGLQRGLDLLYEVRQTHGVPITTDVHLPHQAEAVAEVVDLLQVPAFLCRQTDLLIACAASGRPVNVKKGQMVDPRTMGHVVEKCQSAGNGGVLLTERGTTFGHGDLVVDYRGLVWMREHGVPVVFDATHSVQRPSAGAKTSGGDRWLAPALGRAAVAVGVDAVFAEVHDDPVSARSDAATQLPLRAFAEIVLGWARVHRAARQEPAEKP